MKANAYINLRYSVIMIINLVAILLLLPVLCQTRAAPFQDERDDTDLR